MDSQVVNPPNSPVVYKQKKRRNRDTLSTNWADSRYTAVSQKKQKVLNSNPSNKNSHVEMFRIQNIRAENLTQNLCLTGHWHWNRQSIDNSYADVIQIPDDVLIEEVINADGNTEGGDGNTSFEESDIERAST